MAFVAVTCVGQLASPLQRKATDAQSFPVEWANFATKNSDTSRTRLPPNGEFFVGINLLATVVGAASATVLVSLLMEI